MRGPAPDRALRALAAVDAALDTAVAAAVDATERRAHRPMGTQD